jgi:hypothetical protein
MMRHFRRLAPSAAVAIVTIVSCVFAGCSSAPKQQPATFQESAPASATDNQAAKPDTSETKVDFNQIFPPGPGRALVINNCTTCHTIVPIVVLQLNEDAWKHWRTIHRSRVPALSDADFNTLYDYVRTNFNPSKPVPKLPQDLLDTWTSY